MTERVKLQDPGTTLVLHIQSVKPETIQNTEYWLFSDGKVELPVPQSSMASRLANLNVETAPDLVGETIRFGRSTKLSKFGKPFWDAEYVKPGDAKPAPVNKRMQPSDLQSPPKAPDGDPGPQSPDGDYPSVAELQGAAAKGAEQAAKLERLEAAYLGMFVRVAESLNDVCVRREIPIDASAIQATTFSIFKMASERGLIS